MCKVCEQAGVRRGSAKVHAEPGSGGKSESVVFLVDFLQGGRGDGSALENSLSLPAQELSPLHARDGLF